MSKSVCEPCSTRTGSPLRPPDCFFREVHLSEKTNGGGQGPRLTPIDWLEPLIMINYRTRIPVNSQLRPDATKLGAEPLIDSVSQKTSPAALERHLLDLFAPASSDRKHDGDCRQTSRAALWRLDAIHRAKNFAQLSLSLANLVTHPSERWAAAASEAPARALARTYDELALDEGSHAVVPCLAMVEEVATKLTQIFGHARHIIVDVSGREAHVTPERRRALVLICSELIINALKYAFVDGRRGRITVSLVKRPGVIELIVEDDGVGLADTVLSGEGAGLLDRLAQVSGALLYRQSGHDGHGLRVLVVVEDHSGNGAAT